MFIIALTVMGTLAAVSTVASAMRPVPSRDPFVI